MAKIFAGVLGLIRLVPTNIPSFYIQQQYQTSGVNQSFKQLLPSPPPNNSSTLPDPVSPTFPQELPSIIVPYNNRYIYMTNNVC